MGKDWTGAWDEEEGFFYDVLALPNQEYVPLKVRSLVGLTTLFATFCIDKRSMQMLLLNLSISHELVQCLFKKDTRITRLLRK